MSKHVNVSGDPQYLFCIASEGLAKPRWVALVTTAKMYREEGWVDDGCEWDADPEVGLWWNREGDNEFSPEPEFQDNPRALYEDLLSRGLEYEENLAEDLDFEEVFLP